MHNYAPTGMLTYGSAKPACNSAGIAPPLPDKSARDIQTGPLPLPCSYLVQAGTFPQVAGSANPGTEAGCGQGRWAQVIAGSAKLRSQTVNLSSAIQIGLPWVAALSRILA